MKVAIVAALVVLSTACSAEKFPEKEPWQVAPQNQRTATPLPVLGIMQHSLGLEVMPSPTPTATLTVQPAPARMFILAPAWEGVNAASAGAGRPLASEELIALLSQYDWPVQQALDVAWCESHWDTMAQNSSGATGLFQIIGGNPVMFNPEANVIAAYSKYLDGVSRGNPWWHWNQFGSCGHF
jgi:hypothetical protein